MCGAPSIVPEVGYGLYLPRFHGFKSIPNFVRGVKSQGLLRHAPDDILRQTSLGIPPDRNEIFA